MNKTEFKNPSGKVVEIDSGQWAFVPDHLPPKIDYKAIAKNVEKASESTVELAGALRFFPNAEMLVRPIIGREALLSSKIEGIRSSLVKLFEYESMTKSVHIEKNLDTMEVANCMHALHKGITDIETSEISLSMLNNLHKILMKDDVYLKKRSGKIRTVQNFIGVSSNIREAIYVPPPPNKINNLMKKLEKFIQNKPDNIPTPVWCAMVHYHFEAVHPFEDGNGRIGRILLMLMLVKGKNISIPVINMSEYLEKNHAEYYQRMLKVSQEGQWTEWIIFFLTGITEQCKKTMETMEKVRILYDDTKKKILNVKYSSSAIILSEYLFRHPVITVRDAAKHLNTKYDTAQRAIDQLVKIGILVQADSGKRNRVYQATHILKVYA